MRVRVSMVRSSWRWLRNLLAALGLLVVIVGSTPLVAWWAHAYAGSIDQPKGDVLIVLSAASDDNGGISYSSYWRARLALVAWQTGGFKKIIVSGGGGPGILNYMVSEGIPREAIVAEWGSTTTRENGMAIARMVAGMPGKKVLLTSDSHMFRAIRVFRKLGVDATPMAVPDVLHWTENWTGRFTGFLMMVEETAKIVDYKLHGWI